MTLRFLWRISEPFRGMSAFRSKIESIPMSEMPWPPMHTSTAGLSERVSMERLPGKQYRLLLL